jgi:hypothetical protein
MGAGAETEGHKGPDDTAGGVKSPMPSTKPSFGIFHSRRAQNRDSIRTLAVCQDRPPETAFVGAGQRNPRKRWNQPMVRAKEFHDKQSVRNQSLESNGQPQHFPTRQGFGGLVRGQCGCANQVIEGCLECLQPAYCQAFTREREALRERRKGEFFSEPSDIRRVEDPLGEIHPPAIYDAGGLEPLRIELLSFQRARLPHETYYEKKENNRDERVGEHGHLCNNFESSLLSRVSSRATASESLSVAVGIALILGIGATSQREIVHTNAQSVKAKGTMNQNTERNRTGPNTFAQAIIAMFMAT